jgi:alanine dehydrogenase
MKKGAVIVDVAVDQGGCVETIRPPPTRTRSTRSTGSIHYGVANMPGGVPRTSTLALTNATFPYAARLARLGWKEACRRDARCSWGSTSSRGRWSTPASPRPSGWTTRPVDATEVL